MLGKTRLQMAKEEIGRLKADVEASQDGGTRLWHEAQELREDLEQAQARVARLEEAVQFDHFQRGHSYSSGGPKNWKDCPLESCTRFRGALAEGESR